MKFGVMGGAWLDSGAGWLAPALGLCECYIRRCRALSEREVSAWRNSSVCLIVVGSGRGICTADPRDRVLQISTADHGEMEGQSKKK